MFNSEIRTQHVHVEFEVQLMKSNYTYSRYGNSNCSKFSMGSHNRRYLNREIRTFNYDF